MRRYITSIAIIILIVTFGIYARSPVKAAENVKERYAGSFLAQTYEGQQYYWYVQPETGERYAIPSAITFSRLLRKAGQGITQSNLAKIPEQGTSIDAVDSALMQQLKGQILLDVENEGQAWYVDPLTMQRYYLANGNAGFEVAKTLALDIRSDRLTEIPVTQELGFSAMTYTSTQLQSDEEIDLGLYNEVFTILRNNHYYKDRFSDADLLYGSLDGLAKGTGDEYTDFYTPQQNVQHQQTFFGDSSIDGIGAVIQTRDDSLFVITVIDDAPADRAGLMSKDQILLINGISTKGISIDRATSLIKGPAGTTVVLTTYRARTGETFEVTIIRERVDVPVVTGKTLDNGTVAYFKVTLFTMNTIPEFRKLLGEVVSDKTEGIVIDMRDNIGGITEVAVQLADFWVDRLHDILIEKRLGSVSWFVGTDGRIVPDVPTAVIINGETASAAEIFTAALKFHGDAVVVGETSFGKGTGQTLVDFPGGSALKLTTFEWLPPDGKSIEGIGVKPDIIITNTPYSDLQLSRARDVVLYGY